jgi:hypothetical protein
MISPELAAEIAQEHEPWLNELEGLAIQAIASHDWTAFYDHVVDFQNEHELHGEVLIAIGIDEANTDRLDNSGAGFVQNLQND